MKHQKPLKAIISLALLALAASSCHKSNNSGFGLHKAGLYYQVNDTLHDIDTPQLQSVPSYRLEYSLDDTTTLLLTFATRTPAAGAVTCYNFSRPNPYLHMIGEHECRVTIRRNSSDLSHNHDGTPSGRVYDTSVGGNTVRMVQFSNLLLRADSNSSRMDMVSFNLPFTADGNPQPFPVLLNGKSYQVAGIAPVASFGFSFLLDPVTSSRYFTLAVDHLPASTDRYNVRSYFAVNPDSVNAATLYYSANSSFNISEDTTRQTLSVTRLNASLYTVSFENIRIYDPYLHPGTFFSMTGRDIYLAVPPY